MPSLLSSTAPSAILSFSAPLNISLAFSKLVTKDFISPFCLSSNLTPPVVTLEYALGRILSPSLPDKNDSLVMFLAPSKFSEPRYCAPFSNVKSSLDIFATLPLSKNS